MRDIPVIILKYYRSPKKNDKCMPFFKCAYCQNKSNRTGGGFRDNKGKLCQICENCAVWRYKQENKFRTLASAKARRRRIFDVGYLFNEIVLDIFMSENNIKKIENCENSDDIFIKASQLYNVVFSKEDKICLEETVSQKDIEIKINKRLATVNFDEFFDDL